MTQHTDEPRDDADGRLEQLEQKIDAARKHAEDVTEGSFHDEEHDRFVESGNEKSEREDDQTIAPG